MRTARRRACSGSEALPGGENGGTIDYRRYRLTVPEAASFLLPGAAGALAIGILFYRSLTVSLALMVLLPLLLIPARGYYREKRIRELGCQFIDGMRAYAAAIRVGYSPENALLQAIPELSRIYGEEAALVREFHVIKRRLAVGVSMEQALSDLAVRSCIDDIHQMAEVFSIAKRTGGSLPEILQNTVSIMEGKRRTAAEIRTMFTAMRMEQRIMCIMPCGILAYLNLSGREFVNPLYEGLKGRAIMSVCLLLYGAAVILGERIMKVEL